MECESHGSHEIPLYNSSMERLQRKELLELVRDLYSCLTPEDMDAVCEMRGETRFEMKRRIWSAETELEEEEE